MGDSVGSAVGSAAGGGASARARARLATPADAAEVARLLHDFNVEFGDPSPPPEVLEARLAGLLGGDRVLAVLASEPDVGVAVVSLRPNVWFDGPVALLDELFIRPVRRDSGLGADLLVAVIEEVGRRGAEFVEINVDEVDTDAQRFYRRHGFTDGTPDDRALYFWRELP